MIWLPGKETHCLERQWLVKAFGRDKHMSFEQQHRWHHKKLREIETWNGLQNGDASEDANGCVRVHRWVILKLCSLARQTGIKNFWKCQIHFRKTPIKKSLLYSFGIGQTQFQLSGKSLTNRWVRHTTNGKPFGQSCPKCAVRSQRPDCLGSEGGKLTKPDQISTGRHRSWSGSLGGWKKSQVGLEETEREASRETCVNSYTLERVRTSKGKEKVFWLNMTTHAEAL